MPEQITETTHKRYLGDGAYVDWDNDLGQIKLTAENGVQATNTVYLNPSAIHELADWFTQLKKELHRG